MKYLLLLFCSFLVSFVYTSTSSPHASSLKVTPSDTLTHEEQFQQPSEHSDRAVKKKFVQRCTASWYGSDFHGKPMANGEAYNMYDPTIVAHKTLPKGTKIVVTNLENGRSLVVKVADRGPYEPGRCVDLSYAGAKKLGFTRAGLAKVVVQILDV